ncbi:hypothetical protein [Tissierella sp. Yu-01]|uniref:hypothetical protein n=1 Tax=Tissierella sp. Yu-01 TaxID=3035694 RepID=UPI00240DB3FD|nr:hypothetical protein [Tissierella sp. Yu-01]WFA09578.1 hypothetical protein P3962_03220 [Tissierella sp. Yu-01]
MYPVILSNKDKNFNREELKRYKKRSKYIQQDFFSFCKEVLNAEEYEILTSKEISIENDFFNTEWAKDRRDRRSPLEFLRYLIINKVYEDFNKRYFNEIYDSGLEFVGTEGKNILETNNNITNYPDFRSRKDCLIEFIQIEKGYWIKKEKVLYFRHNKIKHLKELSKTHKIFLVISLIEEIEYQILEITPDTEIYYEPNIKKFNGKWGYKIYFEPNFRPYYDIETYKEKQIKIPVKILKEEEEQWKKF